MKVLVLLMLFAIILPIVIGTPTKTTMYNDEIAYPVSSDAERISFRIPTENAGRAEWMRKMIQNTYTQTVKWINDNVHSTRKMGSKISNNEIRRIMSDATV